MLGTSLNIGRGSRQTASGAGLVRVSDALGGPEGDPPATLGAPVHQFTVSEWREDSIRRFIPPAAAVTALAGLIVVTTAVGVGQPSPTTPAAKTPRWVTHVARYSGCISGGVRAMLASDQARTDSAGAARARSGSPAGSPGNNVQMNDDSYPPLPQNETSVAYKTTHPLIAVAAANDYVSGGVVVMRTSNGGQNWSSTRSRHSSAAPETSAMAATRESPTAGGTTRSTCHSCASSVRCPLRGPRLQVGRQRPTWTPGRQAAVAATNFDYTAEVDESIFNDKELIAVDNTPTSPHYGRIYVTYTKFHIQPDGSSDYCPLQLSYTDSYRPTTRR